MSVFEVFKNLVSQFFCIFVRDPLGSTEKNTEADILSFSLTSLLNLILFVIDIPKTILISQKFSRELS